MPILASSQPRDRMRPIHSPAVEDRVKVQGSWRRESVVVRYLDTRLGASEQR